MQTDYHIYRNKQDIGKRIRYLHSEEPLSIALLVNDFESEILDSISYYSTYFDVPLFVLLFEDNRKLAELRLQFPSVSFIVFTQPASMGAAINVMANECFTTYFWVTRSDIRVESFDFDMVLEQFNRSERPSQISPILSNRFDERLPVVHLPKVDRNFIDPVPLIPSEKSTGTLYPFFGLGIYERALFQRLRGFDESISTEYWQILDFGIRCWLFGYSIFTLDSFHMKFPYRQFIIENRSEQDGFKRCLTKALGMRQLNGKNYPKTIGRYTDRTYLKKEMAKRLALYKMDFNELMNQWKAPKTEID
ncbi:MAG: hypothetical protein PQJ47_05755 [Sphaerochaetaceae bacterium]|nr:hypothetical protein [Sphaerochaetaceae bacterium]